jgi:hypothetical protein
MTFARLSFVTLQSLPRLVVRPVRSLGARLVEAHARWRERRRFRASGRLIAARRGEADHLEVLADECRRSYAADRADSRSVDVWMLPVLSLRGVATRAVLRHRIARGHRQLRHRYEALGRNESAPLPDAEPSTGTLATEAARFGRVFWSQLRPAILPKAPALAGLAVGWWIANTYTDSRWKSLARSLGIGSGGTTVVSGEAYRAMRFWLPLLAAALCAYLGERVATALRGDANSGQ